MTEHLSRSNDPLGDVGKGCSSVETNGYGCEGHRNSGVLIPL